MDTSKPAMRKHAEAQLANIRDLMARYYNAECREYENPHNRMNPNWEIDESIYGTPNNRMHECAPLTQIEAAIHASLGYPGEPLYQNDEWHTYNEFSAEVDGTWGLEPDRVRLPLYSGDGCHEVYIECTLFNGELPASTDSYIMKPSVYYRAGNGMHELDKDEDTAQMLLDYCNFFTPAE